MVSPYQNVATSPPAVGRSVREFEEQMAALRKENFNLKLRLYFMGESIQGFNKQQQPVSGNGKDGGVGVINNMNDGQESLMKKMIDYKVDTEILRKELADKQNILKEAAQAMTQMEKIQKDTEIKYQDKIDELKQRIQYLEMEQKTEKTAYTTDALNLPLSRINIDQAENSHHFDMNTIQQVRIFITKLPIKYLTYYFILSLVDGED